MKDHGILFTSPMVRALLAGTKTQTRRKVVGELTGGPDVFTWRDRRKRWHEYTRSEMLARAPHGPVGRRLWVKETFDISGPIDGEPPPYSDGRPWLADDDDPNRWIAMPHYRATDSTPELMYEEDDDPEPRCKWRSSIHMPRWASRITLEVTRVRLERVQAITEEDARAEGLRAAGRGGQTVQDSPTARMVYAVLWDEISGAGSWASNPWVWVYDFRRVT